MERLNRPGRWLIVTVELVLTAAAVVAAVLIWRGVNQEVVYTVGERKLVTTTMHGDLAGAGIGLCLLAAFLLLDAIRQMVLAARTRHRRAEPRELARFQRMEEAERAGVTES